MISSSTAASKTETEAPNQQFQTEVEPFGVAREVELELQADILKAIRRKQDSLLGTKHSTALILSSVLQLLKSYRAADAFTIVKFPLQPLKMTMAKLRCGEAEALCKKATCSFHATTTDSGCFRTYRNDALSHSEIVD